MNALEVGAGPARGQSRRLPRAAGVSGRRCLADVISANPKVSNGPIEEVEVWLRTSLEGYLGRALRMKLEFGLTV